MHVRSLALLLCAAAVVRAADKPAADPNAVEVRFTDGSVIKLSMLQESVDIVTRFGPLKVPARDIQRIEFGLRLPPETEKQVAEAVAALGSADEKKRTSAAADLTKLGELAYPALEQAGRGGDPTLARRARDVLVALEDKVPEEKRRKSQDTVVTTDFPIVGRIVGVTLKARSGFFGEVQLKVTEMRSVRWYGNERETRVTVEAIKHGLPQQSWMDTGVEVSSGLRLEIKASGTVDMYPGQGGRFVGGPEGITMAGAGNVAVRGLNVIPGALVGKVGENGKPFAVGQKYDGLSREEGKLYLLIAPSPWGVMPSGSFDVRVTAGGR